MKGEKLITSNRMLNNYVGNNDPQVYYALMYFNQENYLLDGLYFYTTTMNPYAIRAALYTSPENYFFPPIQKQQ